MPRGTGCHAGPADRSCRPCDERTEALLRELATLHAAGEHLLTPARRWTTERVRGGSRDGGIVLDEAVVALRAEILDMLAGWTAALTRRSGRPAARRVPGLVEELLGVTDRWPSCMMAAYLDRLVRRARTSLDPVHADEAELGRCARPDCSEPLHRTGDDDGAVRSVACTAGHVWEPRQWLALAARRTGEARSA